MSDLFIFSDITFRLEWMPKFKSGTKLLQIKLNSNRKYILNLKQSLFELLPLYLSTKDYCTTQFSGELISLTPTASKRRSSAILVGRVIERDVPCHVQLISKVMNSLFSSITITLAISNWLIRLLVFTVLPTL